MRQGRDARPTASAPVVQVSTRKPAVDGVVKDIEHYSIDGKTGNLTACNIGNSSFFMLRDPALFGVNYDAETSAALIVTE